MIITELIQALQAGNELKNSANWKNKQMMISAIVAVFALGITIAGWCGIHLPVTQDDTLAIAGGIAAILGMLNYGTVAVTSSKIDINGNAQVSSKSAIQDVSPEHSDVG